MPSPTFPIDSADIEEREKQLPSHLSPLLHILLPNLIFGRKEKGERSEEHKLLLFYFQFLFFLSSRVKCWKGTKKEKKRRGRRPPLEFLHCRQQVPFLKLPVSSVVARTRKTKVRLTPSTTQYRTKRTLKMSQPNSTQNPVMRQQKIIIPNTNGEKLVGILHETGSVEIVIVCHGFRSTKEDNTMVNLAVALETEGITAFRFDFSGNGESEGSFHFGNYRSEAEDLRAVIQYFSGGSRITSAIVGHSKGGDVVLLYASKYHDIPTVVNVSGRHNLERGIEERVGKDFFEIIKKDGYFDVKNRKGEVSFRVTEESLMDRLNTNMHEACLQINKNCRVLTVHGSADEVIPVEDALEFAKIIPNHKLHIAEGANHNYTSHQTELASVVLAFIKEGLHKGA